MTTQPPAVRTSQPPQPPQPPSVPPPVAGGPLSVLGAATRTVSRVAGILLSDRPGIHTAPEELVFSILSTHEGQQDFALNRMAIPFRSGSLSADQLKKMIDFLSRVAHRQNRGAPPHRDSARALYTLLYLRSALMRPVGTRDPSQYRLASDAVEAIQYLQDQLVTIQLEDVFGYGGEALPALGSAEMIVFLEAMRSLTQENPNACHYLRRLRWNDIVSDLISQEHDLAIHHEQVLRNEERSDPSPSGLTSGQILQQRSYYWRTLISLFQLDDDADLGWRRGLSDEDRARRRESLMTGDTEDPFLYLRGRLLASLGSPMSGRTLLAWIPHGDNDTEVDYDPAIIRQAHLFLQQQAELSRRSQGEAIPRGPEATQIRERLKNFDIARIEHRGDRDYFEALYLLARHYENAAAREVFFDFLGSNPQAMATILNSLIEGTSPAYSHYNVFYRILMAEEGVFRRAEPLISPTGRPAYEQAQRRRWMLHLWLADLNGSDPGVPSRRRFRTNLETMQTMRLIIALDKAIERFDLRMRDYYEPGHTLQESAFRDRDAYLRRRDSMNRLQGRAPSQAEVIEALQTILRSSPFSSETFINGNTTPEPAQAARVENRPQVFSVQRGPETEAIDPFPTRVTRNAVERAILHTISDPEMRRNYIGTGLVEPFRRRLLEERTFSNQVAFLGRVASSPSPQGEATPRDHFYALEALFQLRVALLVPLEVSGHPVPLREYAVSFVRSVGTQLDLIDPYRLFGRDGEYLPARTDPEMAETIDLLQRLSIHQPLARDYLRRIDWVPFIDETVRLMRRSSSPTQSALLPIGATYEGFTRQQQGYLRNLLALVRADRQLELGVLARLDPTRRRMLDDVLDEDGMDPVANDLRERMRLLLDPAREVGWPFVDRVLSQMTSEEGSLHPHDLVLIDRYFNQSLPTSGPHQESLAEVADQEILERVQHIPLDRIRWHSYHDYLESLVLLARREHRRACEHLFNIALWEENAFEAALSLETEAPPRQRYFLLVAEDSVYNAINRRSLDPQRAASYERIRTDRLILQAWLDERRDQEQRGVYHVKRWIAGVKPEEIGELFEHLQRVRERIDARLGDHFTTRRPGSGDTTAEVQGIIREEAVREPSWSRIAGRFTFFGETAEVQVRPSVPTEVAGSGLVTNEIPVERGAPERRETPTEEAPGRTLLPDIIEGLDREGRNATRGR